MKITSIKHSTTPLRRFWRNISFRKKTILYTSMILYIFILLFGLLIYNRAVYNINKISKQNTEQRLQSLNEEIELKLATQSTIASILLLDKKFQKKLEQYPSTFLDFLEYDRELVDYLDALYSNSLLSTDWKLYFTYKRPTSSFPNILPVSEVKNTGWYKLLTSQSRNMITWYLEPGLPDSPGYFICSVGIRNQDTRAIPAYIKVNIRLTSITSLIYEATEDIDGTLLLCSQDGYILWCSENDSLKYSDYVLPYDEIAELQPITVSGSLGECTVTVLDGGKYNYTIFCIQDTSSTASSYIDFGRYFLVILSFIIILSLCILILSARLVDGRIVALTADIKRMDEKDLNYHADMTSLDEVGELSRSFSELIERIQLMMQRERQMEDERFELETQALQAQINPHFLFNTLSIINLLAREIEADNISTSLEALANFYYFSLNDNTKMTTVRNELTMLDNYLTICSIRYRNRLHIEKDIDQRSLDYSIPKLVIQPFCENAVFHGFSPYDQKIPELKIAINLEEDYIFITISDNGVGMSDAELKSAMETGFAITNVNKRIHMLYGEPCGVSIWSMPGEGTKVSIKLGQCLKNTDSLNV